MLSAGSKNLLLYYITDRRQFAGTESERRRTLLRKIGEAADCGVDYVQLREKDLCTRELEILAREAIAAVRGARTAREQKRTTRFLINSRTDVAIAVGADGVHLRSDDISAAEVQSIWKGVATRNLQQERDAPLAARPPLVSVSCHNRDQVDRAASDGANFAVFAPVFEKKDLPKMPPVGLEALRDACRAKIPVIALGGVTLENAASCLEAGAAGIGGIRLFQENRIGDIVKSLRS